MPARDKYTDPKLRDEVKEEIHEGDKGGAPGQWSARKAQMMASEYKKRGGGYTTDKKDQDESQKNLEKWGEEDWQTKDGSGNAKQADGSQKRYLPKKAWENMSEKEKKETDEKKQAESKQGKQFVGNTDKAKKERQKANDEEDEEFEKKRGAKKDNRKKENKNQKKDESSEEEDEDEEMKDDSEAEKDVEQEKEKEDTSNKSTRNLRASTKRAHSSTPNPPNKKQKSASPPKETGNKKQQQKKSEKSDDSKKETVGSRKDPAEPPAAKGSADRLPEKGATVHWKALPGYVEGEVVEIVTSRKKVDGKDIKASKEDPRVVLKSNSSGKICVHKPDACFFE